MEQNNQLEAYMTPLHELISDQDAIKVAMLNGYKYNPHDEHDETESYGRSLIENDQLNDQSYLFLYAIRNYDTSSLSNTTSHLINQP